MANITITSDTKKISVDFGVYSTQLNMHKGTYSKRNVSDIELNTEIVKLTHNNRQWVFSMEGNNNTFIIDSINGIEPEDINDLYTKLTALMDY